MYKFNLTVVGFSLTLLFAFALLSCSDEQIYDLDSKEASTFNNKDCIIRINTSRMEDDFSEANLCLSKIKTRASDDPFEVERRCVSNNCVILPELRNFIFPGNVLMRTSVANCDYTPIPRNNDCITMSLSLPGSSPVRISHPSYSKFLQYVNGETQKSSFKQNDEFSFSVEQFTSYDELKQAFGSNVNTNAFFWSSSEEESSHLHLITKATGLYVKFYQTSFNATIDLPDTPFGNIASNLRDSAVYVNSVSFGRLGILTLETNTEYTEAERLIQSCFKTIFSKSSKYLSKEEQKFLDGCDYKVYIIGGDGASAVQSFSGLAGFVNHIKASSFSKEEPGVPINCSFCNVSDNSPSNIVFWYNIQLYEPLYVELLEKEDKGNDYFSLHFYKNRNKVNAIADPKIKFKLEITTIDTREKDVHSHSMETTEKRDTVIYQNTGSDIAMPLCFLRRIEVSGGRVMGCPRDPYYEPYHKTTRSARLLGGPGYAIIGDNPTRQNEP